MNNSTVRMCSNTGSVMSVVYIVLLSGRQRKQQGGADAVLLKLYGFALPPERTKSCDLYEMRNS